MKSRPLLAALFFALFSAAAFGQYGPPCPAGDCECLLQRAESAIAEKNYVLAISKLSLLSACDDSYVQRGVKKLRETAEDVSVERSDAKKDAHALRDLLLKYNAQHLVDRAWEIWPEAPELAARLLGAAWAQDSANADLLPELWRVFYGKDLFYDRSTPAQLLPTRRWEIGGRVWGLDLTADGRAFFARKDSSISRWNLDGGLVWERNFGDQIVSAQLAPDGERLLVAAEKKAEVWAAASGEPLLKLPFSKRIDGFWPSPSGSEMIVAFEDSLLVLPVAGPPSAGFRRAVSFEKGRRLPYWFAPSGDGRLLTTLDSSLFVHRGERLLARFDMPAPIVEAHFSFDGSKILAFDRAGNLQFWDLQKGDERERTGRKIAGLSRIAFSNRNEFFCAVAADSLLVFNMGGGLENLFRLGDSIVQAHFGRDGQSIFVQTREGRTIWHFRIGSGEARPVAAMRHDRRVAGFFFNETGDRLIARTDDGACQIWDIEGRCLAKMHHDQRIYRAICLPDGSGILTASGDGTVRFWGFAEADLSVLRHAAAVEAVAFSKDSRQIETRSGGQKRGWDIENGLFQIEKASKSTEKPLVRPTRSRPLEIASGDRAVVDSIFDNGTARVRFSKSRRSVALNFLGDCTAAAFSADGRWAALGFDNGDVRLVDSAGFAGLVFRHGGAVAGLAFSADGRFLASASADSTARVWMLRPRDLLENLRRLAIPDFSKSERAELAPFLGESPVFAIQKAPAFGRLPKILEAEKLARQLARVATAANKGDRGAEKGNAAALDAWAAAFLEAEKSPERAAKFGFDPSAPELFGLLAHLGRRSSERGFLDRASRLNEKMGGEKGATAAARLRLLGLLEQSRDGAKIDSDSLAALLRLFPKDTALVDAGVRQGVRAAKIIHFRWEIERTKPTRLAAGGRFSTSEAIHFLALQDKYLQALTAAQAWLPRADLRQTIADELAERAWIFLLADDAESAGAAARRSAEMGRPISVRRLEGHAFLLEGKAKKAIEIYLELWGRRDELRPEEPIEQQIFRDWTVLLETPHRELRLQNLVAEAALALGEKGPLPEGLADALGLKKGKKSRRANR